MPLHLIDHHHHLFWKRRLGWTFAHMKSLHTSLNTTTTHQDVNQALSCHHPHSLKVFLFLSLHLAPATFLQADNQSSTLQMPKPPQSATSHHTPHTLYTQKTVQIHTAFPILQQHPAHPSHHHLFHPLQTADLLNEARKPGLGSNYISIYRTQYTRFCAN